MHHTRGPPFFGGLHGLTIHDPSTGLAPLPSGHAHIAAEQIMHQLPGAIFLPTPKVLVDNLPRRQVMGYQPPRTAAAHDIEDAVQDLPLGVLLGPAPRFGFRHQMFDQIPFFVAEVGRIRFSGFHTPEDNPTCESATSFLNTL